MQYPLSATERQDGNAPPWPWHTESTLSTAVLAMIEHVDHGLLLLSLDSRGLVLANMRARRAVQPDAQGGLVLVDGRLRTRSPVDEESLDRALGLAGKGVRTLLPFNDALVEPVGVIPVGGAGMRSSAVIVFARAAVCDASSMALYAKACSLTATESTVLSAICSGMRPHEVACVSGVHVSTVRSQLSSIRQKSRTRSIRHLVETVARLPPVARGVA